MSIVLKVKKKSAILQRHLVKYKNPSQPSIGPLMHGRLKVSEFLHYVNDSRLDDFTARIPAKVFFSKFNPNKLHHDSA
jgi:hypothetical protein